MSISGSNNPFACSPVVFANANSIISLGTITRDGNQFTFSVGFIWKINGVTYQNTAPVVLTISEASEGFTRIDNALLNTSNTIELQQGLESEAIALKPVAPDTNIILTSWNISGTTIGDTEDPIIGTSFVKKSFFAPFVSTVTGADAIIPLDPNGYSEIRLTDASLTSIAGFDLSLITGVPTAEVPYNGKPYIIRNLTGNDITIKNELGAADFPFYLSGGADLVFPNGQAIYVLYDASGFNEIFKSWSTSTTDISGKQDKVFVVSESGTASNDQKYHVVSNATFTDPASPVEGKGYEVFVRNGTATIGGVAYPVGSYVFRTYHSGAWASKLIGGTTWDLSDLTKYSIYAWIPQPASWYGFTTPTVVGTADNASPIFTGTQVQKATRRRYLSASTAGSSAEYYEGSFRQTCMGCGFFFNIKFAFEDAATVVNARSFAGLFSSLAVFGNVNPSTQTNIFGVGADSGDTNLQLIHNDATGTATKVDLGSDFPANTSATDEYLFQCYNLQGETGSMWWRLINVTSMISTDWAEVTTDLPVSTSGAYINPRLWRNNGSTALAVRLAIMDMNLYKLL